MECISLIRIKNDTGIYWVPCGKCYPCQARRTSGWSFRLLKEAERSSSAFFITLTYAFPPLSDNGYMTLHMRHVQAWIKSIRKLNKNKLKYYYVGEYGTKYGRPHYHILLFNAELETIIGETGKKMVQSGFDPLDGKFEHNMNTWKHGYITVGKLEPASVGYCLEYISKGTKVPAFDGDDRHKEFAHMSKGLGESYASEKNIRFHRKNVGNPFITIEGGKKIAIPRYLKNKLFNEYEREHIKTMFQIKADELGQKKLSDAEYLEYQKKRIYFANRKIKKNGNTNF